MAGAARRDPGGRERRGVNCRRARFETLEPRTLLTASFANLGYADPFPPPTGQLGLPSQTTPNIFTDSFTDQTDPAGWTNTGVLSDHYWTGTNTVARPLPTWLQGSAGVTQLSVEFWLRIEPGSSSGDSRIIDMPGFIAGVQSPDLNEPAGAVNMMFTDNVGGEPLDAVSIGLGAIADGQWRQFVATYNTKTACFYLDGQLVSEGWATDTATQIGPQNILGFRLRRDAHGNHLQCHQQHQLP